MLIDRGVIKVGLEIEIPKWNGRTYPQVAADLVEADYMLGPPEQWAEHHKYHCTCTQGGCKEVRSGNLIVPPLVSLTYDGSLPKTGAEFIVSPILLSEMQLQRQLGEIWEIITRNAVWSMDLPDYQGHEGKASPSIHLHVSANLNKNEEYENTTPNSTFTTDILHALSLFSPEFILLADHDNFRRGLQYRIPSRQYIHADQMHHGFIDVRSSKPNAIVYIEWRLFEAVFDDWEYLENAVYMSAGITRSFLNMDTISRMMATGYSNTYSDSELWAACQSDQTEKALHMVNRERLNFLRTICLDELDDDPYAVKVIHRIFDRAEAKI